MRYTYSMKENKDFKRLYYRGKYKASHTLVTYLMRNRQKKNHAGIGITTSKKIGNAVERNRARRIISAAYRQMEQEFDLRGYDLVFVARSGIRGKKSTAIEKTMRKQIASLTGKQPKESEKNETHTAVAH